MARLSIIVFLAAVVAAVNAKYVGLTPFGYTTTAHSFALPFVGGFRYGYPLTPYGVPVAKVLPVPLPHAVPAALPAPYAPAYAPAFPAVKAPVGPALAGPYSPGPAFAGPYGPGPAFPGPYGPGPAFPGPYPALYGGGSFPNPFVGGPYPGPYPTPYGPAYPGPFPGALPPTFPPALPARLTQAAAGPAVVRP